MKRRVGAGLILVVALVYSLTGTTVAHGLSEEALLKISFERRLTVVQASYGAVLDESEAQAVASICNQIQAKLLTYASAIKSAGDAEANAHAAVISRMGGLQALFGVSKIDDAAYKQTVIDYSTELDGFKRAHELHTTFLADVASLDCVASPEAFQAYVTGIRSTRLVLDEHRSTVGGFIEQRALPAMQGLTQYVKASRP